MRQNQGRRSLVPTAERNRYLDRIQTLESELNELRVERDRAISQWQGDVTRLNKRIAALEREQCYGTLRKRHNRTEHVP